MFPLNAQNLCFAFCDSVGRAVIDIRDIVVVNNMANWIIRYDVKCGRVHWLLWNLSGNFKNKYQLYYDYAYHKYLFYRLEGRRIYDMFSVVRTSKRCFRVMYCNCKIGVHEYFSCKTSKKCAEFMEDIHNYYENIEKNTPM